MAAITAISEVARLYLTEQLTAAEIGAQLYMSESAVYRHLRAAGVRSRRRGRRKAMA